MILYNRQKGVPDAGASEILQYRSLEKHNCPKGCFWMLCADLFVVDLAIQVHYLMAEYMIQFSILTFLRENTSDRDC